MQTNRRNTHSSQPATYYALFTPDYQLKYDIDIHCVCVCAQGALDLRYLSARLGRGKKLTESWMKDHHRYVEVAAGLTDAHADLLRFLAVLHVTVTDI